VQLSRKVKFGARATLQIRLGAIGFSDSFLTKSKGLSVGAISACVEKRFFYLCTTRAMVADQLCNWRPQCG